MSRDRSLSPPHEVTPILIGIFGNNAHLKEKALIKDILTPLLQELDRFPDKVLVPFEGNTSMYIQSWAETMNIPYQAFVADWKRNKRAAGIMRDARIQTEATHCVVLLGPKSDRLEKFAERMVLAKRNPKTVFIVPYQDSCLELLEPSADHLLEVPVRKSDSGKGLQSPLEKTQLSFGSLMLS